MEISDSERRKNQYLNFSKDFQMQNKEDHMKQRRKRGLSLCLALTMGVSMVSSTGVSAAGMQTSEKETDTKANSHTETCGNDEANSHTEANRDTGSNPDAGAGRPGCDAGS